MFPNYDKFDTPLKEIYSPPPVCFLVNIRIRMEPTHPCLFIFGPSILWFHRFPVPNVITLIPTTPKNCLFQCIHDNGTSINLIHILRYPIQNFCFCKKTSRPPPHSIFVFDKSTPRDTHPPRQSALSVPIFASSTHFFTPKGFSLESGHWVLPSLYLHTDTLVPFVIFSPFSRSARFHGNAENIFPPEI